MPGILIGVATLPPATVVVSNIHNIAQIISADSINPDTKKPNPAIDPELSVPVVCNRPVVAAVLITTGVILTPKDVPAPCTCQTLKLLFELCIPTATPLSKPILSKV